MCWQARRSPRLRCRRSRSGRHRRRPRRRPSASRPRSGFPDKAYLVTLPSTKALNTSNVDVTENGQPVTGLGVAPPGGDASGAILLIDASNSMKGAPIKNAMAASRAFLGERKKDLPVAIVVFGPEDSVLTDFTTDEAQLTEAVSKTPATSEGTHIYDALINAIDKAKDQGLERTTVVLLSDGTDVGSDASRAEALQAAADANVRVISVGLSSPQYDPETLKSLANRTGGKYVETATPAELQPIFQEIGQQLSSEYELTYRSLLPPQRPAAVLVKVAGPRARDGEVHDARLSTSRRRARSRRAGSTRSSRLRG